MNKKLMGLVVGLTLPASIAMACIEGHPGIFPPNNLNIPAPKTKSIAEDMFNRVITRAETFYAPVFAAQGFELKINRLWDDGTVNASAQQSGKKAIVNMYGGLARHDLVTADAFAMVLCHEIGHHIAGYPKIGGSWASNEGQSDYFASLKCLREMFKNDDNSAVVATQQIPAIVTEKCQKSFDASADVALCQRMSMAGKALADTLASMRASGGGMWPSEPSAPPAGNDFGTPDPKVVRKIDDNHPAAQCRLDTYFQGALCGVSKDIAVSDVDETVGTCSVQKNDELGIRPRCWFVPATELKAKPSRVSPLAGVLN